MKIGTITFHCSYNFGSALQAYALQEYLLKLGHDVHIIDYRSRNFNEYKILRLNRLKSFIADIFFLRGNIRRKNSFQSFWRRYFKLTEHTYQGVNAEHNLSKDMHNYDALICGSDQIWNLDCTQGPIPPFFLSFASDETRKIAYAPSISHREFEPANFTSADRKRVSGWLNRFDSLSVRELSTATHFQQLTDKRIIETLDPTLLLDLEAYKHIQAPHLPCGLGEENYIFAYTLWESKDMIQYLDKFAKKQGLPIVYYSKKPIHYRSRSINCWGIGPADFLTLIDKADCVISNSFHATVFSILYGKPFLTFGTEKSSSRMKTLLKKLGLPEEHLLPPHTKNYESAMPFASKMDVMKLNELRMDSENFIKYALK